MPKGLIGNMNSQRIATKYLKLIIIIVVGLIGFKIYKSGIMETFSTEKKNVQELAPLKKSDLAKQKKTLDRIKYYDNYLGPTLDELKILETSSSVDLNKDLLLDETYLEDFLNK